jgi:alpha-galactosidase
MARTGAHTHPWEATMDRPAAHPTASDAAAARAWVASHLAAAARPPFSFLCGGRASAELLPTWRLARETQELADAGTRRVLTWTDPATGLEVRCVALAYRDHPAVEWTLHFRNGGATDAPLLAEVQALDASFGPAAAGEPALHHAVGSPAAATDYRPLRSALAPGAETVIATRGGRPSDSALPYFNLAWDGGGVIVALGWPGQWSARFAADADRAVRVRGGQELTGFRLHPGEEVRGPLIALLFYRGDWIDGQNVWRRWMVAHNLPRPGGALPAPFVAAGSSNQFHEMEGADEANQKLFIDRYLAEGVGIDYWWMDAGWYATRSGRWQETGTWEVDRRRFPNGLRAITDHARERGLNCVVWFEPERVAPGSWLDEHHPEWLLALPDGRWKLLDLGDEAAWRWVVERFDGLVRDQGVGLYRQDFNMAPLDYWRASDPPERQGIAEIRHLTGYLAYWDELRRRHPGLLLDTCASGGRRLDLETLRRSVPLHKSDHDYRDYAARQSQAYGIAFWIPFHGAPVCRIDRVDTYGFRSAVGLMVGLGFDVRQTDLDYPLLRRLVGEWRRIARYYYGDYYPLTPYSVEQDCWLAWQYDRPDLGEGVVQAFRRAESPVAAAVFRLRGLDPDATYRLTDADRDGATELRGRALLEDGLPLSLAERPSSAIVTYRRIRPGEE